MGYIERKPVTVIQLTCSHPQVFKIWEYGGAAAVPSNSTGMIRFLCMQLKNGDVKQFLDSGEGQAEIDAEKFLSELPEK